VCGPLPTPRLPNRYATAEKNELAPTAVSASLRQQ
jgi:hypothetical protein